MNNDEATRTFLGQLDASDLSLAIVGRAHAGQPNDTVLTDPKHKWAALERLSDSVSVLPITHGRRQ